MTTKSFVAALFTCGLFACGGTVDGPANEQVNLTPEIETAVQALCPEITASMRACVKWECTDGAGSALGDADDFNQCVDECGEMYQ